MHHLRIMRSGRLHHVDFHLIVPFYWSVEKSHTFQGEIARKIASAMNNNATVLIHLDPCTPKYCSSCSVEPCKARSEQFAERRPWTIDTMIGGPPFVIKGDERDGVVQHG